ncbi:hypothetical protein AGMMS49992_11680 [Clostridia bacterium]|nr:hypothetical protein AGMMS49992_11680 [Clostridia bacterium]
MIATQPKLVSLIEELHDLAQLVHGFAENMTAIARDLNGDASEPATVCASYEEDDAEITPCIRPVMAHPLTSSTCPYSGRCSRQLSATRYPCLDGRHSLGALRFESD